MGKIIKHVINRINDQFASITFSTVSYTIGIEKKGNLLFLKGEGGANLDYSLNGASIIVLHDNGEGRLETDS